jgi:hypothetical protein
VNHDKISRTFVADENPEKAWRIFHDRLVNCCFEIWEIVKPVLCIDSPEGQGDEEDEKEVDIGIKDTLSFSWRVLKEASSLMHATMQNPKYGPSGENGLIHEDYRKIGDLAYIQLSELRHRGAFTTVAQCFAACCAKSVHPNDDRTTNLLQYWYTEALRLIENKSTSLTRRSAGLPAIMTGLLSAYTLQNFDNVILDLQKIARLSTKDFLEHGKSKLPQVHALNCLKDIFGNSSLGPRAEKHVESILELAVECMDKEM